MCTVTEAIEDDEDPFVRMQLSCETEGGPTLFEFAVEADAPLVDTSWLGRELTLSADASWSVFFSGWWMLRDEAGELLLATGTISPPPEASAPFAISLISLGEACPSDADAVCHDVFEYRLRFTSNEGTFDCYDDDGYETARDRYAARCRARSPVALESRAQRAARAHRSGLLCVADALVPARWKPQSAVTWCDAIPQAFPRVDWILLVRDDLARKRFLRAKKPEVCLVPFAELAKLGVAKQVATADGKYWLVDYEDPPTHVVDYFRSQKVIDRLDGLAWDSVLATELVEEGQRRSRRSPSD